MNPPPPTCQASSSSKPQRKGNDAGEWRPWADIATLFLPSVSFLDCVRLSSVCRSWHDFLADYPLLCRPQFPWLMFQDARSPFVYNFCSPSDGGSHPIHLAIDKECIAASHGWLLLTNNHDKHVQGILINPLSKACIHLPTFPRYLTRVTLSAAPTEPGCMALGLSWVGRNTWNIHYSLIRDKTWYVEQAQFALKSNIAAMGGKFYFLCQEGLAEINCNQGHSLKWLKLNDDMILHPNIHDKNFDYNWLVESNGELLNVTLLRIKGEAQCTAYVHRADFAKMIWSKVEDLCGQSLFLSKGACFSSPAVDASKHVGGCIYLALHCMYNRHDDSARRWLEFMVHRGGYLDQLTHYTLVCERDQYSCTTDFVWFMPPTISSLPRMVCNR